MVVGIIIVIIIFLWIWWAYYDYKKQNTIHIDSRGYERDGYGRLVHRKVAYQQIYDWDVYPKRFREYDIHHRDRNKRNNSPDNLQILTREEHEKKHLVKYKKDFKNFYEGDDDY